MTPREKIDALNPWFYRVKVGDEWTVPGVYPPGGPTDASTDHLLERQHYRHKLLVRAPQQHITPPATILDVGCNCGYWASAYAMWVRAIKGIVPRVIGIDGRETFLLQAKLYYETSAVPADAIWRVADVNRLSAPRLRKALGSSRVDLTLCLGILYHVADPIRLLTDLLAVSNQVLVDTRVGDGGIEEEPGARYFNAIDGAKMKSVPKKADLLKAVAGWGFSSTLIEPPTGKLPRHLRGGKDDYDKGRRVTLVLCRES